MILATCQDGANYMEIFRAGYHGVLLWQVDEMTFKITKDTTTYSHFLLKYVLIQVEFGIDW